MFRAELRKLLALPSALVAIAISVLGTTAIAALNGSSARAAFAAGRAGALAHVSTIDASLDGTLIGTIGVIVLGVVLVSSEYTTNRSEAGGGRQILTSLVSVGRGRLMAAKLLVLTVVSALLAVITIPAAVGGYQLLLGQFGHPAHDVIAAIGRRAVGCAIYWICMALLAFAVTVFTRSGIIPMIVFLVNTSVVSFTMLLAKVFPPAKYLPDVAGTQMFTANYPIPHMPSPVSGGIVMAAWTIVLIGAAVFVFGRRDA
jgi:hypothetical protein